MCLEACAVAKTIMAAQQFNQPTKVEEALRDDLWK